MARGNTHNLLCDHSTSGGQILPKLKHIWLVLLIVIAFTLPLAL